MDATETMLKAVDAMDSTRRNLMGLAELCSAMDTLTHEDVWMTIKRGAGRPPVSPKRHWPLGAQ